MLDYLRNKKVRALWSSSSNNVNCHKRPLLYIVLRSRFEFFHLFSQYRRALWLLDIPYQNTGIIIYHHSLTSEFIVDYVGRIKMTSLFVLVQLYQVKSSDTAFPHTPDSSNKDPSCRADLTCEPTSLRVDKVMLFDGLREVEIIEDCHCEVKVSQCMRVPALKIFNFETPYETVIDVGKCAGSKADQGVLSETNDSFTKTKTHKQKT